MSKHSLLAPVLALALAVGCSQKNNAEEQPLLRVHFAGAAQTMTASQGAKLKQIDALPATAALRQQVFEKLGRFTPQYLNFGSQTNLGALIKPLVEDCYQSGAWLEVGGDGAKRYGRVAIQMSKDRLAAWQKNLGQLKTAAGGRLAWTESSQWLLVVTGADAPAQAAKWQQAVKAGGLPGLKPGNWCEAQLNLPKLAPLLELPLQENLPVANLAFSTKGEEVRITGTFDFPQAVVWRPEPWRVPANTIKDPLVSFTAANGVAPWLEKTKPFSDLKLSSMPGQVYGWSQVGMPLLVYVAANTKNASNMVTELATKLPPVAYAQLGTKKIGDFLWRSNRAELIWQGLPIMVPRLLAVNDNGQQCVVAEVFPLNVKGSNAPAELFAQVTGKQNLVYYDWEITENRLISWRQIFQLLPLFSQSRQVPTDLPAQKWLEAVAPHLGNTATEITYVSARQMSFTRRGHLGLTGFEIMLLTRAMDLWGQPADFGRIKIPTPGTPAPPKP